MVATCSFGGYEFLRLLRILNLHEYSGACADNRQQANLSLEADISCNKYNNVELGRLTE